LPGGLLLEVVENRSGPEIAAGAGTCLQAFCDRPATVCGRLASPWEVTAAALPPPFQPGV